MTLRRSENHKNSLNKAEGFLLECIKGGLAHSLDRKNRHETWVKPYPEVTGYLLSYFCQNNKWNQDKLRASAQKLLFLQHQSGGFPSFYDTANLYTFDTAQILQGLLSWYLKTKDVRYLVSARKAGDFLCSMQLSSGLMWPIYDTKSKTRVVCKNNDKGSNWGSTFSPIQVKDAAGLILLSKIIRDKKYLRAAEKLACISLSKLDYLYTHPLAYYLEGLLALGNAKDVKQILINKITPRINKNGFIPYFPGAKYAYTSGSVQLGILLWKVGFEADARNILSWATQVQNQDESGGLFQYARESGEPDKTIHREINSWGTKYFAELIKLVS